MGYQKSSLVNVAFGLVLLVHLGFTLWVGRIMQMDEIFFKAAGREWAATGRFAAPECMNFLNLQPPCQDIWFAQPPVYTFLFGVFVKVLGFGPWQCILFDELIHVVQAWLTFQLARRIAGGILTPMVCFLLGSVVLMMGTIARPDEMATCFGMAGMLPLVSGPVTARRVIFSGICLGITAGVSIAAGGMMGLMAVSLVIVRADSHAARIRLSAIWAIASMGALAAVLAPILIPRPDALQQYTGHVHYQYLGRPSFLYLLKFGLVVGAYYYIFTVLLFFVGFACLALSLRKSKPTDDETPAHPTVNWLELWLGPIAALIFLLINFYYKYTYLWFMGPWLLVAAAANIQALLPRLGPIASRSLIYMTVLAATAGAMPLFRQQLIFLGLPPEQRYARNEAIVREIIPPGSSVISSDFWWGLANDYRVYDIGFGYPPPQEVDYCILTQNDTGIPGQTQTFRKAMAKWVPNHFVVVRDDLNRQPVVIAGVPLKDSSFGFGGLVLAQMGPRAEKYERKTD